MTGAGAFLPYGRHAVDEADIAAVVRVLRGDWLTTGPEVERFEAALSERMGGAETIACSSGTAALQLVAAALRIGPGDTVIVPAITFAASASAFRLQGAEILFADVDPDSGLMTAAELEAAIRRGREDGRRLRAVVPVHFAGQCAAPEEIATLAARHGLLVVEDACHALGTRYVGGGGVLHEVGACAHSDAAVFSFHPVKTIATGEGGAVATRRLGLAAAIRRLRNHGITRDPNAFTRPDLGLASDGQPNPWYYEVREPGFNHRISDLNCALGRAQLARLDRFVARRAELVALYQRLWRERLPWVRPLRRLPCRAAWHLHVVLIDFERAGRERAQVMSSLRRRGIGSQVHYVPLHWQPCFAGRAAPSLPGAEAYYRRALSLPLHATMADDQVGQVVDGLAEALTMSKERS